jgi:hypothetical protein
MTDHIDWHNYITQVNNTPYNSTDPNGTLPDNNQHYVIHYHSKKVSTLNSISAMLSVVMLIAQKYCHGAECLWAGCC